MDNMYFLDIKETLDMSDHWKESPWESPDGSALRLVCVSYLSLLRGRPKRSGRMFWRRIPREKAEAQDRHAPHTPSSVDKILVVPLPSRPDIGSWSLSSAS